MPASSTERLVRVSRWSIDFGSIIGHGTFGSVFRARDEEGSGEAVAAKVIDASRMKWEKKNRIKRFQGRLSKWFKSFHIQAFIGVMIAGNFVQEALRLQIRPDLANGQYGLRPDMERAFEMSDGFFTALCCPCAKKGALSVEQTNIFSLRYLLESSGKIFAKIEWKDTSKNPTGSKNNSLSE